MDSPETSKKLLEQVYPDLRVRILRVYSDVLEKLGFPMRTTSGVRSFDTQLSIWKIGRDEFGTVIGDIQTKAKPGKSWHNYGLAVDSCFSGADPYWSFLQKSQPEEFDRRWSEFGRYCKAHGLVWGYDWNGNGKVDKDDFDRPHAQITYGLTLDEAFELYDHGGIPAVWAKCDKVRGVQEGSEWKRALAAQ